MKHYQPAYQPWSTSNFIFMNNYQPSLTLIKGIASHHSPSLSTINQFIDHHWKPSHTHILNEVYHYILFAGDMSIDIVIDNRLHGEPFLTTIKPPLYPPWSIHHGLPTNHRRCSPWRREGVGIRPSTYRSTRPRCWWVEPHQAIPWMDFVWGKFMGNVLLGNQIGATRILHIKCCVFLFRATTKKTQWL